MIQHLQEDQKDQEKLVTFMEMEKLRIVMFTVSTVVLYAILNEIFYGLLLEYL